MVPEHITDNRRAGVLELIWPDRRSQQLSHAYLRSRCQCSACRKGKAPAAPHQLRITEIHPVGAYGVQLVFSDGHDRGIYPWPYLRSLPSG